LAVMNGHAEAWDVSYEMHQFIAKRRKTSSTMKLQDLSGCARGSASFRGGSAYCRACRCHHRLRHDAERHHRCTRSGGGHKPAPNIQQFCLHLSRACASGRRHDDRRAAGCLSCCLLTF
jgi:hypothetical protein